MSSWRIARVGNDLEMRPSGRNETPNVVTMETSSKSPCVDVGKRAASKPYKKHGIGSLRLLANGSVEDYDVDVRNIDKGVVDIRNNVVDKCCKQSKTYVDLRYVSTTNMLE
jgi:hypothetical protein